MPPRTRPPRGRAAPPETALSIAQLHDDALLNAFRHLNLRKRESSVALVCHHFHELCGSPALLSDVVVDVGKDPEEAPPVKVARSLLQWLAPRAAHVRRLALRAWLTTELENELYGLLPAMSGLQHLRLSSRTWLELRADMSRLTQLRSVRLVGYPLHFDAAARLPPSITRVELCDERMYKLPQQLALLPNLQRLRIFLEDPEEHERCYESDDTGTAWRLLSRLSTLTHLSLEDNACPPRGDSLAALTALRHLQLGSDEQQESYGVPGDEEVPFVAEQLDAALPALQQLTCLVLNIGMGIHAIPAAAARMPQLRRLFLFGFARPVPILTAGFTSLQRLGAPWEVLSASVPALAAMPHLQQLLINGVPGERDSPLWPAADSGFPVEAREAAWEAFWEWAAQHAPLQQLTLPEPNSSGPAFMHVPPAVCARLAHALLRLFLSRPSLSVARFPDFCRHLSVEEIERE